MNHLTMLPSLEIKLILCSLDRTLISQINFMTIFIISMVFNKFHSRLVLMSYFSIRSLSLFNGAADTGFGTNSTGDFTRKALSNQVLLTILLVS